VTEFFLYLYSDCILLGILSRLMIPWVILLIPVFYSIVVFISIGIFFFDDFKIGIFSFHGVKTISQSFSVLPNKLIVIFSGSVKLSKKL
jgi:hypothetical protein